MNPFPNDGFTAFNQGDASTAQGLAATPDDTFMSYVQDVLWKQGVDVTSMDPNQLSQLYMALWQDQFVVDIYNQSPGLGSTVTDPTELASLTDANIEAAIRNELFDPTKTHNQGLVAQGVQMLTMSGVQLTSSQQSYAQNLGGGNPTVLAALARAAKDAGVPYNVALAVAMAESGLDPNAHVQNATEDSWGLFQLNTMGGEGAGMSQADLRDPYTNALTALRRFAEAAQQDPGIMSDPGAWAAAAQRPKDPSAYASRVNNLLQSGFGGSPSGQVPKPFDGSFPITEDHNEGDPGIDYGTPVGTAMYTPFAGTIRIEDKGKSDWGKRALVVLDNGYTFAIGHLTSFSVSDGQRVNPGDMLGLSGGATSDPSSGNSTGPHVEIQWISPAGNFLDPHAIIDPILAGTATFRSLNLTGAEGSGVSATAARDRALGIDPILEAKYPAAVSAFEKYFGRHPTSGELTALIGRTGGNPDAIDQYLRRQPSHIQGLSVGMYQDVKGNLDSVSQQLFGHAGTDGMVKELAGKGETSPTAIKFWLEQMDIAGKMDPNQYANIYALSQPYNQAVANESGYDPRTAAGIYNQAQQQGVPVPTTPPPGATATSSLGIPYRSAGNQPGPPDQQFGDSGETGGSLVSPQ